MRAWALAGDTHRRSDYPADDSLVLGTEALPIGGRRLGRPGEMHCVPLFGPR